MGLARIVVLTCGILASAGGALRAQSSDALAFAVARTALDTHGDCPAAERALNRVSSGGRQNAQWIYYAARTYECLRQYDRAMQYYLAYNEIVPGQPEVIEKIGEIGYQLETHEHAGEVRANLEGAWLLNGKRVELRRTMIDGYAGVDAAGTMLLFVEPQQASGYTTANGTVYVPETVFGQDLDNCDNFYGEMIVDGVIDAVFTDARISADGSVVRGRIPRYTVEKERLLGEIDCDIVESGSREFVLTRAR